MLSDEFLKNCFGSDDDEEEKFEIKHKKDRIVSYHPNSEKTKKRIKVNHLAKKIFPWNVRIKFLKVIIP